MSQATKFKPWGGNRESEDKPVIVIRDCSGTEVDRIPIPDPEPDPDPVQSQDYQTGYNEGVRITQTDIDTLTEAAFDRGYTEGKTEVQFVDLSKERQKELIDEGYGDCYEDEYADTIEEIRPLIDSILTRTDFDISDPIYTEAVRLNAKYESQLSTLDRGDRIIYGD